MTPLTKPVSRQTSDILDGSFGADRRRALVVTLQPGNGDKTPDVLMIRPKGTRRAELIPLKEIYRIALRARVTREVLERARAAKEKKKTTRERRRITYQDRKFRQKEAA